jgi:hypothetical protein
MPVTPTIQEAQMRVLKSKASRAQHKKDSFIHKCCRETWIYTCRRLKQDPYLSPCTKINSKWIKELNIRSETLKQFQGGVSNTLEQIGIRNDFPNRTQKAQHLKEAMNKWDCIKLKSFCTGKEAVRCKTANRMGENLCQLLI